MRTFRNPIGQNPDPWVVHHEGFYYATGTSHDHIAVTKAASLGDLSTTEPVVVWRDTEPTRSAMLWAPELQLLDGPDGPRWYLYYTASDADDHLNHRMHVLESTGDTPLGPFEYRTRLNTDPDNQYYAIDGSALQLPTGDLYFFWAGWPGHVLFVSRMANPCRLVGERVHIPASGFGCTDIREGPVCLRRNGKVFLVYSACDTGTPDYRMGMLSADETDDLTDVRTWHQHPDPVFRSAARHGVYGPGHNGFFTSPDGTEDWFVYHAKTTDRYTYEGRTGRAQRLAWHPDGRPDFGVPLPLTADIPLPSGDPGSPDESP
ncbi:glycoside hydrolase family 43 protein [Geodermatophilus sp. URMC 64]